jgi:hypothetical protein
LYARPGPGATAKYYARGAKAKNGTRTQVGRIANLAQILVKTRSLLRDKHGKGPALKQGGDQEEDASNHKTPIEPATDQFDRGNKDSDRGQARSHYSADLARRESRIRSIRCIEIVLEDGTFLGQGFLVDGFVQKYSNPSFGLVLEARVEFDKNFGP